jgi:hypothetical protein
MQPDKNTANLWKKKPVAAAAAKPGSFVMPFGKYRGRTLDQIAAEHDGEEYLDWLIGWLEETKQKDSQAYKKTVEYMDS